MRFREWVLILGFVITICALAVGGPVQTAAAEHAENDIADNEIVLVRNITTEGTKPGIVQLEEKYHLGDDITEITVQPDGKVVEEIQTASGFRKESSNAYTWERGTADSNPSLRMTFDPLSFPRGLGGKVYVSTTDWTLTRAPRNYYQYSWRGESPATLSTVIQSPEKGVSGSEMVYIGNHSRYEFDSSAESFRLALTNYTEREISSKAIRTNLVNASDTLLVNGRSETVTVFIGTKPIGHVGRADGSDFIVHECCVPPGERAPLLLHEYVHTRQEYHHKKHSGVAWTTEAEAEYYGDLLALQHGELSYELFRKRISDLGGEPTDVVLSDPNTWNATIADYEIGSRTIAALDATIRNATNGERTYQAVLRQKNSHEGNLTLDDMERYASEAAGTDLTTFFETYIRSNSGPPDFRDRPQLYIKQTDGWDSDSDGLPDKEEVESGTHPFDRNTDGDHLNDSEEIDGETDPLDYDTNDDGIVDGYEPGTTLEPIPVDSDGDGLTNEFERANDLDPNDPDTDGDGVPDGLDRKESTATAATESTDRRLSTRSTENNESLYATQTRGADGPGFGFPALIISLLVVYLIGHWRSE
jgi:hypothetical protein